MQKTLPKGWKMVKLGEVCKINPPKPELSDESSVTFLPMNAVGDNGEIFNPQIKQYKDVKKGYTGFIDNDVLFAKITPCMENGKGVIARDLNNSVGFGSTEFHVIRPSRKILPEIIFRYLSLKPIRKFAKTNMTGSAGQKRVPQSFLNSLPIPLPSLPTQYKIVKILEEADKLRKLRQQADKKMKDLIPSLFVQMFGDPATNPKGWEVKKLGEVATVTSSKRIFQEDYVSSGIPFYRTKEIVELSQNKPISLELFISEDKYKSIKEKFDVPKQGDILVSAVGTIGISWLISDEKKFYFKDGNLLWIKKIKGVTPVFLKLTLDYIFNQGLNKLAFGAAYNALTIVKLKQFSIPLPPLPLQREFAELVEEIEAEKARQAESRKKLDELFNSLMQRAFKGKLVA